MRLLQVNTLPIGSAYGGAEKTANWVAAELSRRGHEITSLGLRSGEEHARLPDGIGRTWRVPNVGWPLNTAALSPLRKATYHLLDLINPVALALVLTRIVRDRPDGLFCHNLKGWSTTPWLAARLTGVPVVQVLHDYATICARAQCYRPRKPCNERCVGCAPRRAASRLCWPRKGVIVGVSADCLARHRRSSVFRDVAEAFVVYPKLEAEVLRGPKTVTHKFGFLGRIDEAKGIEVLLGVASLLQERVLIAGSGDPAYVDSLKLRYPSAGEWLGTVTPGELFRRIQYLVVPSLWPEPYGRVVEEAAAAGTAVVAFAVGGIPEAAIISGARVMLIPPGSDALLSAMREPRCDVISSGITPSSASIPDIIEAVIGGRRGLVRDRDRA